MSFSYPLAVDHSCAVEMADGFSSSKLQLVNDNANPNVNTNPNDNVNDNDMIETIFFIVYEFISL